MAKTVKFPAPSDDVATGITDGENTQLVYTRQHWGEPWEMSPGLYALEVTWSVAPTLPVAVLEMDYGYIRQTYHILPDDTFREVLKTAATNLVGRFVKIACYTLTSENSPPETVRYWYGVIEEAHDEQGGVEVVTVQDPDTEVWETTGRCHGRITLVAYGLEKLLADHQILTSMCEAQVEVGVPFDFNRAGPKGIEGNRAATDIGIYTFSTTPSTAVTWATRDIVNYLLTYQVPADQAGVKKVLWGLHGDSTIYVTDQDKPLLKCESATTYSLLSQLIDRRRGIMWWCEVDDDDDNSIVWIKVNSMVAADVVGNNLTVTANSNQVNIEYDTDPLTQVVINSSDLPRYGQVIARGPRIRCVGTFSKQDNTLEAAWEAADETTYEAGGTAHPANTPLKRKQARNDVIRRTPKLAKVYSLFRVPEDWDFQVGDGLGGDLYPMFLDADNELQLQDILELAIEQTLPILDGEDYEGTRVPAGLVARNTVNEKEMLPLCFFRRPYKTSAPYKYQPCEGIAAEMERTNIKENERLQCHLTVPYGTMTINLSCQGEPQHAIAYADFTPIAGEDKPCGQFDWQKAVFTFSIESQFHTEKKWPDPPAQSDTVRRKIIYAGDQYYQHYVAPQTVVGIDEDGYLVRSDGGWIPTLGDPVDPIPFLEDVAKISAAWYTVQHYVMTLETYRIRPRIDISLGMLVLAAGGGVTDQDGHKATVNSPITQIKFTYPRGSGDKTPPARMQIKTWAGELDAVEFIALKPAANKILHGEGHKAARRGGRK